VGNYVHCLKDTCYMHNKKYYTYITGAILLSVSTF